MASAIDYMTQGTRIFFSGWKQRFFPKRYAGNAEEICQKIVKDCWNGRFFQTSAQNFPQFWTRDFGWCTASLLKLKYDAEMQQTLRYALNRFRQYNKVTTTISPRGKPFDFPQYAVDSLPWLVHSIRLAKFPYHSWKPFLNKEIKKFYELVIDSTTGLVKPRPFSSMKDLAVRKSSCYDNCMVAMLAKDLKYLKLFNPLEHYNYPELIKRHLWSGKFFYDDLTQQEYVAGDANLFPYILGIIADEEMMRSSLAAIREAGLDIPLPLKYTAERNAAQFVWQEKIALHNYEGSACWTHMGPLFVKWVQHLDNNLAEQYIQQYREAIEKNKGFVEVFFADGKPYRSWFYYADRSMLWACNYVTL